MDVSSGCWPSESTSSNGGGEKQRKKSMNDSGKGSALSRHDEDCETSFQYDSLDVAAQQENMNQNKMPHSNDLYREVFDSPVHRNYRECNLNIRKHLNSTNNNNDSIERDSLKETNHYTDSSSRTSDNVTQISSNTKTRIPLDMITRSIQTSQLLTTCSNSSGTGGTKEKCKVLPASFLAQLNSLGETQKAPVFVIYPNYTLPNLDFISTQSEIILSPIDYKETSSVNRRRKARPFSCTDTEHLKQRQEYSHVVDWKSLVTLLPAEYYKMLKQNIPEEVRREDFGAARPLFCMSPPIKKARAATACDCFIYTTTTTTPNTTSSESTGQPPSSGYRGSSTMLDDLSDINNESYGDAAAALSERPPSGRAPRSILRRANSGKGSATVGTNNKSKRNSMFDEGQPHKDFEKRRSVQDPYYMVADGHNIIETYIAEMNDLEMAQGLKNRLPNRSMPKTTTTPNNPYDLSELEINKAIHNRINLMNTTFNKHDADVEARMRAENFLTSVPKSELKYYAEIANILESMDKNTEFYDRLKLKNDVSRALAKKVSFKNGGGGGVDGEENHNFLAPGKLFNTPPNSPNISVAASRMEPNAAAKHQKMLSDREKQEKINSNRFKRLQIQWELLSKDSQQLQRELETKSGGSTPTSGGAYKSKIPRPVSYPASKYVGVFFNIIIIVIVHC